MNWRTPLARAACAASLALVTACASPPEVPRDLVFGETAAEESTPLGGEALAMMRSEMQRAYGDMQHFRTTLDSLNSRRDRSGAILFVRFVDAYMGMHLAPLLKSEWQSRHPELMALDANLRFAQADVLIQMRDPRRAQGVISEIERRFQGRESMLVDFPFDSQGTLGEALVWLRENKWRG